MAASHFPSRRQRRVSLTKSNSQAALAHINPTTRNYLSSQVANMPGVVPMRRPREDEGESDLDASSPSSDKRPRLNGNGNGSQVLSHTLCDWDLHLQSPAGSSTSCKLRKRTEWHRTARPLTWIYRQSRNEELRHVHFGRIPSWSQLEHDHRSQRYWKEYSGLRNLPRPWCQTRRPRTSQGSFRIRQAWHERGRNRNRT